jgi:hypothetical protein
LSAPSLTTKSNPQHRVLDRPFKLAIAPTGRKLLCLSIYYSPRIAEWIFMRFDVGKFYEKF